MFLYTGEYESGDLKPTENDDDNLEVTKWFSPEEVTGLPLSPPLKKLLAFLGKWKNKYIFNYGFYVSDKLDYSGKSHEND